MESAAPSHRPEVIELLEPNHLMIIWDDGHESIFTHRRLRLACECAKCVDEWTHEPLLEPGSVPEEIRISRMDPSGNYGVVIAFSDGHGTGIYTYARLRAMEDDAS